jgi:outer membrane protein TolC
MRKNFTILLAAVLTALTSPLHAQAQPANPDSSLRSILDQLEGTHLSLHSAVQYALKNSTSVRMSEAASMAARGTRKREAGMFDPELFFSMNYLDRAEPTASFFAGATVLSTTQTLGSAGLRWESPIGTNIQASLNTLQLNTNSSFAFLNPEYTTLGSLSLRQPLLGGFDVSARKELTKADKDMEAAGARRDQEVLGIETRVEQDYWDLYAAERDYAVQKLTRDRAEAFLKDTEVRAKAGFIGPNQVANAKTFLAEQEILLLDREELLDRLSDRFASLIGTRPDAGHLRFVTVDIPPDDFPLEEADVLVNQAIHSNLELQAAQADIDGRRALSSAAFWEALPSVSLVGSVGGSGLAGTPQDVIFGSDTLRTTVSGGFGDAVNQAVRRQYPSWSVGVEVSIPIGLRSGLGEQERLDADVLIAEQEYIRQSRVLEEEVRASYQELFHGKRRLKAAKEGVEAAQEQVRIGWIEFRNGRTTAFELVRLGADFAVAQQRYTQALVRSAKAAASMRSLTSGTYPGKSSL